MSSPSVPCAPAALLFDLDGTLVDSRQDIAAALNAALTFAGAAPLLVSEIMPMVGDGARKLVERGLAARGRPFDLAVMADFDRAYLDHPCVHTTLLGGACDALALGVPCALVTNKPRAVTLLVLERLGIADAFAAVWAGGDGPLKPAPDGIRAIAARLAVPVQSTWMIGDGAQDILAGRAAGAFTVGVRGGIGSEAALREAAPDALAETLHDVVAWVTAGAPPR